MGTVLTYDMSSAKTGEQEVNVDLGDKVLYKTLKDTVVMYQSNSRQGDAHTKNRSELAGHAKKPWKQKKTGRARAGDRRSPLWVGGATTFGPRNKRNWYYNFPRQMRHVATRSALLGKMMDKELIQVSGLKFDAPSSSTARKVLADNNLTGSVLVITAERDSNIWKSFRNFPKVSIRTADEINAHDLLAHKMVLMQEGVLESIISRVKPGKES
ncbi:MAG: 50S ribosomal protein L4 [Planctomycetota bacterium]|nr:50S ribosomal protein L4 [Planctomycetota bacterium]MDA1112824.1 50S ribosomal protein L4 [Planctomycetota bacterium]